MPQSSLKDSSFVEHFARPAGDADLAAVPERLVANPGRLAGARIDMGDVRDVDRQLLLDDAAGVTHALFGVAAGDMDALDDESRLGWKDAQHFALLALVAAAVDDDVIA